MSGTGNPRTRIRSTAELLGLAHALEAAAASRYRGLAARMARQGDHEMAAQFDVLAGLEDQHAAQIDDRSQALLGFVPDPAVARWELPADYDDEAARGAVLTPYTALAFAVRNEERAFAFYTYVAADATDPGVRALAEDMARDELQHAALLRHLRRKAFRRYRPATFEIPQTAAGLMSVARRWHAEAAAAHLLLAAALEAAGEAGDARIFRNLAEEERAAANGETAAPIARLRSAADGFRVIEETFDRLATIGESSKDEAVVATAQRLSIEIIRLLAFSSGIRNNSLIVDPAIPA